MNVAVHFQKRWAVFYYATMARQDIQIDTNFGELETAENIVGKSYYDFVLLGRVDGLDNDNFCYGEILIPKGFEKRVKDGFQVHIRLPYKPLNKELQVRLRMDVENSQPEYILNQTTNRPWYRVVLPDNNMIRVAQYRTLGS